MNTDMQLLFSCIMVNQCWYSHLLYLIKPVLRTKLLFTQCVSWEDQKTMPHARSSDHCSHLAATF